MNCEHEAVASIHEAAIMQKPKMTVHEITVKAAILAICTAVALGFLYACKNKSMYSPSKLCRYLHISYCVLVFISYEKLKTEYLS